MADNNEEEYLDALLKSMLNQEGDDAAVEVSSPVFEELDSSDDDMAMLSRMLLDDNNISYDEDLLNNENDENTPPPIEHSDMESFLSLDDLLGMATNDDTGAVLASEEEEEEEHDDDEPEITPIQADEDNATDLESLLSNELNAAEEASEESLEDDFFGDFDEIGALFSNENTAVNEEALRRAMSESDEQIVHDSDLEKELADILSLDEGMSVADIPNEQPQNTLTEEEKMKIENINNSSDDLALTDEDAPKKGIASIFGKKNKKEKTPKDKKEKVSKIKKDKPQKEKSKFSFKEFFSKFNDEEENNNSADNNQKLIDELYKDKKSLDDEDIDDENVGKKGKKANKEKKPKTPKPKKEKKPKEPKEVLPQEKVHIGKVGVAIITLLVIIFLFGGFFGVRFINYQLTINSAKKYFEMGNYELAYDNISGLDIMSKDTKLCNKIRIVMTVYQGYTSYNNYIEMDREVEALDALINAIGRKQQLESDALKYDVSEEVNTVYDQILSILVFYEIDEQMALDLYKMTNYEEYIETLHGYEGVAR